MPAYVYLFAAIAIASVPLFVWSMRDLHVALPTRRRKLVRANLGAPSASVPNLRQLVLSQRTSDRVMQPTMDWLAKTSRRLTPASMLSGLEQRRQLAGADSAWTIERLLAAKLVFGGIGALLGLTVFISKPSALTVLAAVLFTAAAFYMPDIFLGARGRQRQSEIERAFPGVLDQLSICVEAGLGLDAALDRSARSGRGPLAEELARVMQDVQLGVSRQVALEAMVKRTDVSDIRHFVVALGQANRYGVPVLQALRAQAMEAREQRRSRAEEHAQKMSVKLLFPLVFCILPALFAVLLGPAAIRIAHLGLTSGAH
jgi:tight adherence protein C